MSTSSRIHGEFLRFLYILAHWHTRAAIGHATALAVARRTRVAEHTLRRNRARLPPQDDLIHPYTAPVAI